MVKSQSRHSLYLGVKIPEGFTDYQATKQTPHVTEPVSFPDPPEVGSMRTHPSKSTLFMGTWVCLKIGEPQNVIVWGFLLNQAPPPKKKRRRRGNTTKHLYVEEPGFLGS